MWRRPTCQGQSKALDISRAVAWVAPGISKASSNFIRYNCEKICSWSKRPETILNIRKKAKVINKTIIYNFFKDFFNHRKKSFSPTYLNAGTADAVFNNLENKIPSDTYWRFQLVCTKVQAHSSSEPPLECNQDQMSLSNQIWWWLFNHFEVYMSVTQFQISSRGESR